MEKVVIVRYCEIHLKGKNRGYFEKVFMNNLEKALTGIRHEMHKPSGRYVVENFDEGRAEEIVERLRKVFGTHTLSVGYKVEADISDSYAGKFSAGDKAEIRLGSSMFAGSVANIVPSVTDGRIQFTVLIDDSVNDAFRPGLRVDVNIVNAVKEDVLKIANRAFYSGPGMYDLWVVSGNVAEKRKVRLGENSYSEVEVISGLEEGDRVIVSNMNRYRDRKLKIR